MKAAKTIAYIIIGVILIVFGISCIQFLSDHHKEMKSDVFIDYLILASQWALSIAVTGLGAGVFLMHAMLKHLKG